MPDIEATLAFMFACAEEAKRRGYIPATEIIDQGWDFADFREVWFGLGWYERVNFQNARYPNRSQ
jgi:hypothetical protein